MRSFIQKYKVTIGVCVLMLIFGFGWWILANPGTTSIGTDITVGNNLYVTGNVGIGTTAPTANLQVAQGTAGTGTVTTAGTTALVGSGTQFLNTFKVGDTITVSGETVRTIATITNNTNLTVTVAFSTSASGLTYTLAGGTRFSVLGSGNVGIGRTPLTNKLEVEGTASKTTAGDWLANSDLFIKTDVTVSEGLSLLSQLNPVKFRYTDEYRALHPDIEDRFYYNFVAQDYAEVFPDYVKGSGEFLGDGHEILQLDPHAANIVAIRAIQELKQENDALKARIESLEAK